VDYGQALPERTWRSSGSWPSGSGAARAKAHRANFSVIAASSDATAAKIVIYEAGKGKINGHDPQLGDGVYVLVRVHGTTARTIGVAPRHHERFAYFRLHDEQGLAEMADFICGVRGAQYGHGRHSPVW
jgi:hypothetical protein